MRVSLKLWRLQDVDSGGCPVAMRMTFLYRC